MLKIIHTADIHLDSPFRMEDLAKAQARKNELRAAFSSLMFWARSEGAEIMLIAGDLFDSPRPTPDAVEFVLDHFRKNPDIRFVITPGNHDFYSTDSVYARYSFPENVTIFPSSQLSSVSFEDIGGYRVNLYGYAFTSPILDKNPFAGISLPKSGEINLLTAHGTLTTEGGKDCPIRLEEIRNSGFDYVALGHIHNLPAIEKTGDTYYGYAGSLEPRAFNDRGERGAFLVECDKSGTSFTCRPTFYRLCKRIYALERLNLTGLSAEGEILEKAAELLHKKGYGSDTLLRLICEGTLPSDLDLPVKKLSELAGGLYYCEIEDRTTPGFDLDALRKDPTVKGELTRILSPLLSSEKDEERLVALRALKYGLSALAGNDVSDF